MDWQLSDVIGPMLGACTPGDIRVHYTALFVDVASMMGAVHPTRDLLTAQAMSVKGGGSSRESYSLGMVHKGALSAADMLQRELQEGRCTQQPLTSGYGPCSLIRFRFLRWLLRVLLFVWAALFFPNIFGSQGNPIGVAVAAAIMAGCWTHYWGLHFPTLVPLGLLFVLAVGFALGDKPKAE